MSSRTGLGLGFRDEYPLGQPGGGRAGGWTGAQGLAGVVGAAAGGGVAAGGSGASEDAGPGTWCVYLLLAADEEDVCGVTNDVDGR